MSLLAILNYIAVSFFGCILSAAFCNVGKRRGERWILGGLVAFTLALQGGITLFWGQEVTKGLYPILTHLPLILALWYLCNKLLWSVSSCLTAYLCCQFRRWISLLLVQLTGGDEKTFVIIELIVTVPLVFFTIKTAAPAMRQIAGQPWVVQIQLSAIPVIYYIFDYATTVFTDALYSGNKAVVEFMPACCCIAYIWFLIHISDSERMRYELEMEKNSQDMRMEQSVREMSALRKSNAQAAEYRHDLRHHLQYVYTCIEENRFAVAQQYIREINKEIEAQRVVQYCENENINLVLSVYEKRAKDAGVRMNVRVALSEFLKISSNDICAMLSNALENALHATIEIKREDCEGVIEVEGYEKQDKIFLQVSNSFCGEIIFENGLPVTEKEGHGIGTRCICSVVEKYGGICSFSMENERFYVRISL